MDPSYLGIRASEVVLRDFSALADAILPASQPLDIDRLYAREHFGRQPAPEGRHGLGDVKPLQAALKLEDDLAEPGVCFGCGAKYLASFVLGQGLVRLVRNHGMSCPRPQR